MRTKFQLYQKLPWPKTLTWSGKNGRMNRLIHRPENIMPLFYRRWGIKIQKIIELDTFARSTVLLYRYIKKNVYELKCDEERKNDTHSCLLASFADILCISSKYLFADSNLWKKLSKSQIISLKSIEISNIEFYCLATKGESICFSHLSIISGL